MKHIKVRIVTSETGGRLARYICVAAEEAVLGRKIRTDGFVWVIDRIGKQVGPPCLT